MIATNYKGMDFVIPLKNFNNRGWISNQYQEAAPTVKNRALKDLYQRGTSGSRRRRHVLKEEITIVIFQGSPTETWK